MRKFLIKNEHISDKNSFFFVLFLIQLNLKFCFGKIQLTDLFLNCHYCKLDLIDYFL